MATSENSTTSGRHNQFQVNRIQYLSWKQFNGKLNVKSNSGIVWSLFFSQGRLILATGGSHPLRLWQRHLIQHCPEIVSSVMDFPERDNLECWEYHALTFLVKQKQIAQKQVAPVITDTIAEVLFDVIQQASLQQLSYDYNQETLKEALLIPIETELALKQANQAWESWRELGFAKLSPNLAPVLRRPEQLQQLTTPAVYQNFVTLINGKHTLRDLAVQMKQGLLLLTRSLIPYIRKGIIGLVEVADEPSLMVEVKATSNVTPTQPQTPQAKMPLIACVDDSPQTCLIMEKIFTQAGFRFVSIQDSVQALPILLQRKPDLIFLDLMMPVVNGYEICSQLRRVSLFTNTPMIILTGSDGLVDRVRAKVVGASDFLSKPVEAQKVLAVVQKYLSVPPTNISASRPPLKQQGLENS